MISLIVYPNGLRFINVYIYCKPPYQPKYQYLRKVLEPLKEIGYFQYTDDKNIVAMDVIKPNSLIIFDDVATCRQDIIRQYFSLGRHRNTDCFSLCQTYTAIPKHVHQRNTAHRLSARHIKFKVLENISKPCYSKLEKQPLIKMFVA
nr:unnamed protein product [Callosobruchus analis]